MGLFQSVGDSLAAGADWVEKTGESAIDTTVEAGKKAYEATKDAAVAGYDKTKEATIWAKDRAVAGAEWTKDQAVAAKDKAVATYDWTVRKADELNRKGKKKVNDIAGEAAEAIGQAATKNKTTEKCIEKVARGAVSAGLPLRGRIEHFGV